MCVRKTTGSKVTYFFKFDYEISGVFFSSIIISQLRLPIFNPNVHILKFHLLPMVKGLVFENYRMCQVSWKASCLRVKTNQIWILLLYPYNPMCVSTVYLVLSRAVWTKQSEAYFSGGIRTHDLCNFRAVSYQLDQRDGPIAGYAVWILAF